MSKESRSVSESDSEPPPIPLVARKASASAPTARPSTDAELSAALLGALDVQVGERQQLVRELGRGGVGAVSVIHDSLLHRDTAIKKLFDQHRNTPFHLRGFIREAQITAQLDHPNIVPVHDAGVDADGAVFFTMKLIDGRSMKEILESGERAQPTPEADADRLTSLFEAVSKVCDALAFAHSRGVLHCDIKPDNIMVGDYGEVYLTDWGGAQIKAMELDELEIPEIGRQRITESLVALPADNAGQYAFGTFGYMAPEQTLGRVDALDERTDVFLVGALLYRIVTGHKPYEGDITPALFKRIREGDFPPVDDSGDPRSHLHAGDLPRIVRRAMAAAPKDRYPSIASLKADLMQFLRGGRIFQTRRFPAGSNVVTEGETGDTAFIVVSGEAEVCRMAEGRPVVLATLRAGDSFGELALITALPRAASVVAKSDLVVVVVTRDLFEQELSGMKSWMGSIVHSLAGRLREHLVPKAEEGAAVPASQQGWEVW